MSNFEWAVVIIGFGWVLPIIFWASALYALITVFTFFRSGELKSSQKIVLILAIIYIVVYWYAQRII